MPFILRNQSLYFPKEGRGKRHAIFKYLPFYRTLIMGTARYMTKSGTKEKVITHRFQLYDTLILN